MLHIKPLGSGEGCEMSESQCEEAKSGEYLGCWMTSNPHSWMNA